MKKANRHDTKTLILLIWMFSFVGATVQAQPGSFQVLGFYTAKHDAAHISFVHEANRWFADMATRYHFRYDSTADWSKLNTTTLAQYQVLLFLDTRPEDVAQRSAFEAYMKNGGGWMGFHFSAFALTPSDYPQNWDWYHTEFLGSGAYVSNTWRPTAAIVRVQNRHHPAMKNLPKTFTTSPNEWYRWSNDLRKNKDIKILLAIDKKSFPLGTGPKPHEIWHEGFYPVAWTNKNYHMLYFNMGHNDIDYENKTGRALSSTFGNAVQDKMILNSLLWLGQPKKHTLHRPKK